MNAPDLFSFEPTVRIFPVVEVEGIRAIVERDRWCSFYAVDAGKPFPSETGFRSAGNDRPGPAEDILAAVIAEQRKDKKGPLPIPVTVYRQPFAGEERPQPARGAMVALRQLVESPLNVDLILAVYAKDQVGRAWGTGDPLKLVEITQRILGNGFQAESSPDGEGLLPGRPQSALPRGAHHQGGDPGDDARALPCPEAVSPIRPRSPLHARGVAAWPSPAPSRARAR